MNHHFGIVLGAITVTVIGGAFVLDRFTGKDAPAPTVAAEHAPIVVADAEPKAAVPTPPIQEPKIEEPKKVATLEPSKRSTPAPRQEAVARAPAPAKAAPAPVVATPPPPVVTTPPPIASTPAPAEPAPAQDATPTVTPPPTIASTEPSNTTNQPTPPQEAKTVEQ